MNLNCCGDDVGIPGTVLYMFNQNYDVATKIGPAGDAK